MMSTNVTTPGINQETYPHLNRMHVLSGGRLFYIDSAGRFQSEEMFSRRFAKELDELQRAHLKRPMVFRLGYFLPALPKKPGQLWFESATLVLRDHVLAKLQNFEVNVQHFLHLVEHPLPLAKEMSAYTGMRRLIAYGTALGYYPVVAFDEMHEPIVINLDYDLVSHSHNEFQQTLKQKLINGELFEKCQVKPFLKAVDMEQQLENSK